MSSIPNKPIMLTLTITIIVVLTGCSIFFGNNISSLDKIHPINESLPKHTQVIFSTSTPSPVSISTSTPFPYDLNTRNKNYRSPISNFPLTWTPVPPLNLNERNSFVEDLYTNPSCKLPCVWGIFPGVSTWNETWQFLERFISADPKNNPNYSADSQNPDTIAVGFYSRPETYPNLIIHKVEGWPTIILNTTTYTVDYIAIAFGDYITYHPQNLMSQYGKPDQIYLYGGESAIASGLYLIMYYPEYHFISVHYTDVDRSVWDNSLATICFETPINSILVWPKLQELTFNEALRSTGAGYLIRGSKPLRDVSDFGVDEFYYRLITSNNNVCIDVVTNTLLYDD